MASVTYMKFMTKDELINFITKIHRFLITDKDGRVLVVDNRVDSSRPRYIEGFSGNKMCLHAPAFKLNAFDYEDPLISGSGYVRYTTFQYGKKESRQGEILREIYGFSKEN